MSRKDELVQRFGLICSNVIIEEWPTIVEWLEDVEVMIVVWLVELTLW